MDYLKNYKEYLKYDRRLAHQTIYGYVYCVTKFIEFLGCDPAIITTDDIREMFKELSTRGLRNSSIANYICALRSFYNWLYYINKTERIQDISFFLNKIVRTTNERPVPQVPSCNEVETLRQTMHAYKTAYSFNKDIPEYKFIVRDLAAVEMLIGTGARSTEVKGMSVGDIDLVAGTVLIRKGKGNHQRVSIFGGKAKETIREYIELWQLEKDEKIFFFTRFNLLNSIIKRWAHRAGINPNLYPHSFRHYHITKAQRDGVPTNMVADQVGHVNLNTTRRYTHLDHDFRRESYQISELQK